MTEQKVAALEQHMCDIDRRLSTIEDKLDNAIEGKADKKDLDWLKQLVVGLLVSSVFLLISSVLVLLQRI